MVGHQHVRQTEPGSEATLQGSSRDRDLLPQIPILRNKKSALTLPMLPYADANLANQVGAVPDVDG